MPAQPNNSDPSFGLLYAVADRLIPLFTGVDRDIPYAFAAALGAYRPESQADYANIGRILAGSLVNIELLAKTVTPGLPP